ncbi:MAG: hypothetical protein AAB598_01815 [Patescibacteria group bacterium]
MSIKSEEKEDLYEAGQKWAKEESEGAGLFHLQHRGQMIGDHSNNAERRDAFEKGVDNFKKRKK